MTSKEKRAYDLLVDLANWEPEVLPVEIDLQHAIKAGALEAFIWRAQQITNNRNNSQ